MPNTPRGLPLPPDTTRIEDFALLLRQHGKATEDALNAIDDGAWQPTRSGFTARRVGLQFAAPPWTTVTFPSLDTDTGGYRTNSSTFTIPAGRQGVYAFTAQLITDVALAGRSFLALTIAGVDYRANIYPGEDTSSVSATVPLNAGDTIQVRLYHSSGADRYISSARVTGTLISPYAPA